MAEPGYSARCRERRTRRIARARANIALGVSLVPLAEKRRAERTHLGISFSLSLAAACHAGVAYAAFSHCSASAASEPERVQVKLVEQRVVLPEPALVAEEMPIELPAPAPEPKKANKPKQEAPAPEKAPEPVAIVGLTLESTSSGGSGAAFAVGSTLAGTTSRTAQLPQNLPPAPPNTPVGDVPVPVSKNRIAQPRAAAGVRVEPARRLARVEPEYPSLLERQGIEADVTVRVSISASGAIESVELVTGGSDPAFDAAALAAARKERFSPETHDGLPVATSLTYTYRFRIKP